jgi:hypothetical protein
VFRIELTPAQLSPPDPKAEEDAFGYVSTHQTALHILSQFLEAEAADTAPRIWSVIARCAEAARTVLDRLLEFAYGEPTAMRASIAEPDRIGARKDAITRDNVARFIMRKKRYAALGLRQRLADKTLSAGQREHSLHTLALITGRKFHRESTDTKFVHATAWMQRHLEPPSP